MTLLEELTDFANEAAKARGLGEVRDTGTLPEAELVRKKVDLLGDLKRRSASLRESLAQVVADFLAGSDRTDLDEVIDLLRSAESEARTRLMNAMKSVNRARRSAFPKSGSKLGGEARAVAATDRLVAALNEFSEMLRDFRWRLMTIRADFEEVGDAPVFDDAEELLQYLSTRSG